MLEMPAPTPSLDMDATPLRHRLMAVAAWLSAPPTPGAPPPLRAAAARVLAIGFATLLGAVLLYGAPDGATLRRHACTVAGCADVTPTSMVAGRVRPAERM